MAITHSEGGYFSKFPFFFPSVTRSTSGIKEDIFGPAERPLGFQSPAVLIRRAGEGGGGGTQPQRRTLLSLFKQPEHRRSQAGDRNGLEAADLSWA